MLAYRRWLMRLTGACDAEALQRIDPKCAARRGAPA